MTMVILETATANPKGCQLLGESRLARFSRLLFLRQLSYYV